MKKRLVETVIVGPSEYKKSAFLNEADQTFFVERTGEAKKEFKAKAVFTFPISRPDKENLNGRIYNEALWKKTQKKLKDSSTFGLMDHPANEGSTKDIWCVWRNLRFNEAKDTIIADSYLVGKWGEQIKEILEAGGRVGLSTSGFGEFLEDQKTIDPNSYELERVADFVFNPSYDVFGTQADKISQDEATIKEKEMKIEKIAEEVVEDTLELVETETPEKKDDDQLKEPEKKTPEDKADDKKDDKKDKDSDEKEEKKKKESEVETEPKADPEEDDEKEEKKKKESEEKKSDDDDKEDDKKAKADKEKEDEGKKKEDFLAKSFKLNMISSFKQAKKLGSAEERITSFADLLSYFAEGDNDSLRTEIQEELDKESEALQSSQGNELEKVREDLEALKSEKVELDEKLENSLELLDSLKVYATKLKEMYDLVVAEMNGMVSASDYREAQVYLEGVENEKTQLEMEVIKLKSTLSEKKAPNPTSRVEEEITVDTAKAAQILESANPEVLSYYNKAESSNPAIVIIKEDILKCKTLMEAQRTAMRLKPLWDGNESSYDRKVVQAKNTYAESSKQTLPLKNGWM